MEHTISMKVTIVADGRPARCGRASPGPIIRRTSSPLTITAAPDVGESAMPLCAWRQQESRVGRAALVCVAAITKSACPGGQDEVGRARGGGDLIATGGRR